MIKKIKNKSYNGWGCDVNTWVYLVGDSGLASCESERGCCCLWVLSEKLPNEMCLVLTLSCFLIGFWGILILLFGY